MPHPAISDTNTGAVADDGIHGVEPRTQHANRCAVTFKELLTFFFHGDMTVQEREAMKRHEADCPQCHEALQDLDRAFRAEQKRRQSSTQLPMKQDPSLQNEAASGV